MRRKYMIPLCITAVCLLTFPALFPCVSSETIENQKKYVIETRYYHHNKPLTTQAEVTEEELNELIQILNQYQTALTQDNTRQIDKYESILQTKGILDLTKKPRTPTKMILQHQPIFHFLHNKASTIDDNNISNTLCFVNAIGKGMMIFTIGILLGIFAIFLLSIFPDEILGFLIPFYVMVLVATHLIPFRVLLPMCIISMEEGTITATGTAGTQQITVSNNTTVGLQLGGFTGLTINIPSSASSDGILFVSGFSLMAKTTF